MRHATATVEEVRDHAPEEDMGAWDLLVSLFKVAAVCLLLVGLGWAASERGRAHRPAQERRAAGVTGIARSVRSADLRVRDSSSSIER
jgi:hypothetical protein